MNREYLEDYEKKEMEEYERLVLKRIRNEKFDFRKDKYPPDERFRKLRKPTAVATFEFKDINNVWAQVPFCGSLILTIPSLPKSTFDKFIFESSNIHKIVDFAKETGKLQVVLQNMPTDYEDLDFLNPVFEELKPPVHLVMPLWVFGNEKAIQGAAHSFHTLASIRYYDLLSQISQEIGTITVADYLQRHQHAYTILKLGHYIIVEDIENLLIDDPIEAYKLLAISARLITSPLLRLRFDLRNYSSSDVRVAAQTLPAFYRPEKARFPCEIGRFLIEKKLTYAPMGLDACKDVISHYDAYDLQKLQEALNDAIVENHPDAIDTCTEGLSEVLDNVWSDATIPRKIKNLKIGVPISIAAIGTAVSALSGHPGGFLAGLGFDVAAKFLEARITKLSERAVKFFARSYQANVYDFKEKYKDRIVK